MFRDCELLITILAGCALIIVLVAARDCESRSGLHDATDRSYQR